MNVVAYLSKPDTETQLIREWCLKEGHQLVEGHIHGPRRRKHTFSDGLFSAIAAIREGRASGLVIATWAGAFFHNVNLGSLAEIALAEGWRFAVLDTSMNTLEPDGQMETMAAYRAFHRSIKSSLMCEQMKRRRLDIERNWTHKRTKPEPLNKLRGIWKKNPAFNVAKASEATGMPGRTIRQWRRRWNLEIAPSPDTQES